MTFPGEAHGTGGEPQEKGLLYWLSVRDPAHTHGSLLRLTGSESKALWKALHHLHHRHFPGTPEMKTHLEAVTALAYRALVIEKLAEIPQLSSSRFKVLFKSETGIPRAEFALRACIHEAAARLRKRGATVTSVAFSMGFLSSQYLASTFKRFTNESPGQYLPERD